MSDRVATTADRTEIAELFARYAWGMDMADVECFESVWTEDASWTSPPVGMDLHGRNAIMEYFRGSLSRRVPLPDVGSQIRLPGTPIVDLDGDEARSRCEFAAFVRTEAGITPYSVGHYVDQLRRVDGRWLLADRLMMVNPMS